MKYSSVNPKPDCFQSEIAVSLSLSSRLLHTAAEHKILLALRHSCTFNLLPLDKTSSSLHISEQFPLPFAAHLNAVYNYLNNFHPHLLPNRPLLVFAGAYHGQTPTKDFCCCLFIFKRVVAYPTWLPRSRTKATFPPHLPRRTRTSSTEVGHPGEAALTSVLPERQGLAPHPVSPAHQDRKSVV